MYRKSQCSCYRSHLNSANTILFSNPHQSENYNLKSQYISHAANGDHQNDNKSNSSVTLDKSKGKCTCEQLNFCEIHTVSNEPSKSFDYANKIESPYKDIPSIMKSKHAMQFQNEMKLHHGTKNSSDTINHRNYDFKQYLFEKNAKNNTVALELVPIINIDDDKHGKHKRRDYHSINLEINKSANALTHHSAIKAHSLANPIDIKSKRTIYHKELPSTKYQYGIDGVSNIYRSLMGPTPDESILAGLQTVYDACNHKESSKEQTDHETSIGLPISSSEKETSCSGTYMNISTICINPTKQRKSDYTTYKDPVKYSFTPSLIHSSSSFNTCSPAELENISINSFSQELSYDFPNFNKNKNRSYAALTSCHFNPMQVTPTMVNICDRICFSEASMEIDARSSNNSLGKSNNKTKNSKKSQKDKKNNNTSKKSGKHNSSKSDIKDNKGDKSSKSTKRSSHKKSKEKKSKGSRTTRGSVSSKLSTENKNNKLTKKNKDSNKASIKSSKKKYGTSASKNISTSNDSDMTLSKKSYGSVPCDDPGTDAITLPEGRIKLETSCYPDICGANLSTSAAGITPRETRYAIAKISRFRDYTIYEILKSSERKPSKIPVCTEGVFILQTKRDKQ